MRVAAWARRRSVRMHTELASISLFELLALNAKSSFLRQPVRAAAPVWDLAAEWDLYED